MEKLTAKCEMVVLGAGPGGIQQHLEVLISG